MEDTLATREATKSRIGPWCVLQSRNPAAPGMRYATLLSLVAKGQIGPRSIVRGPTTHQLWRYAVQVRGLSREFGFCYSCGQPVEKAANYCPSCERPQGPRGDPDALLESPDGLALPAPGMAIAGGAIGTGPFASGARGIPAINARGRIDVDIPAFGQSAGPACAPQRNAVLPIVQSTRSKPNVLRTADLAAALQDGQAPVPRKSLLHRALVMLIFIGLGGGIVLLYMRPDLRDQSQQWIATNYATARQRLSVMLAHHQTPAPANSNDVDNLLPADSGDVAAPRPVPTLRRPILNRPQHLPQSLPLLRPSPHPWPSHRFLRPPPTSQPWPRTWIVPAFFMTALSMPSRATTGLRPSAITRPSSASPTPLGKPTSRPDSTTPARWPGFNNQRANLPSLAVVCQRVGVRVFP
jgi:hypothetical protein